MCAITVEVEALLPPMDDVILYIECDVGQPPLYNLRIVLTVSSQFSY